MEHIVKCCKDCPLCVTFGDTYFCEHPGKINGSSLLSDMQDGTPITPSDCPLFKESLTIKIED